MGRKRVILPTPLDYMDYINKILIDSYTKDVPTESEVQPTPTIAKFLVNQDTFMVLEEEDDE